MALQRTGLQFVAKGVQQYIKSVGAAAKVTVKFNTSIEATSKASSKFNTSVESAAKATEKFSTGLTGVSGASTSARRVLGDLGKSFAGLKKESKGVEAALPSAPAAFAFDGLPSSVDDLTAAFSKLSPSTLAASAGIAGAGLAFSAFIALGQRGAAIQPVRDSFDSLTQSVGLGSDYLSKLEKSAGGTIRTLDLLKQTNLALAGASQEFGKEFGEALPQLLEIARTQAAATGQSVDFLFQSLVTGIKRNSPLIIDNLGFIVKGASDSSEILAQVLEQGNAAIDAAGGVAESSADKIAKLQNTFVNLLDRLSVAVQPAFAPFLDALQLIADLALRVLEPALRAIEREFERLGMVLNLIVSPLRFLFDTWQAGLNVLASFTTERLDFARAQFGEFVAGVQIALEPLVSFFRDRIGPVFEQFGNLISAVLKRVGFEIDSSVASFAEGAANVMGAFASGIIMGGAKVLKAVADIAQGIANLLIGQSPPPEGPLSVIDKGGANTMAAWIDGLTSVSIQPVKEVAAKVDNALGNIGTLSLPQVEARLSQLDLAIRPFNEQLQIAEARLNAIKGPSERAIDAINRQIDALAPALEAGNSAAADTIRQLDALRAAQSAQIENQQRAADIAAIQVAQVQSQQAEERALLAIQKARLGTQKQTAKASTSQATAGRVAAQATKQGGTGDASGAATTATTTAGALPEGVLGREDIAGIINGKISPALDEFQTQLDRTRTEGGRLQEGLSGFPERIGNAFDGVAEGIASKFDPLITFFTDSRTEGTLAYSIANLGNRLAIWFSSANVAVNQWISGRREALTDFIAFWASDDYEGGFYSSLLTLLGEDGLLTQLFDLAIVPFQTFYDAIFGEAGIFAGLGNILSQLLTKPIIATFNSVVRLINDLIERVESAINRLIEQARAIASRVPGALAFVPETVDFRTIDPITLPAARAGGIFSGGMLQVGEGGREVVGSADKMAVFPNNFVTAVDRLTAALVTQPVITPSYAGAGATNYNNSTSNMTVNVNQPMNPVTLRQQLNTVIG